MSKFRKKTSNFKKTSAQTNGWTDMLYIIDPSGYHWVFNKRGGSPCLFRHIWNVYLKKSFERNTIVNGSIDEEMLRCH